MTAGTVCVSVAAGKPTMNWLTWHCQQPVSELCCCRKSFWPVKTCCSNSKCALLGDAPWFFLRYRRYINHLLTYLRGLTGNCSRLDQLNNNKDVSRGSVEAVRESYWHSHFITFRMRHSRGKVYIGHRRLCVCVCLSVCPSPHSHTAARTRITWGNGRGSL